MSSDYDSLPACLKKCLGDAAESAGCSSNDVECICSKDLAASAGVNLFSCVTGCGDIGLSSVYGKLQGICAKVTSSGGSSAAATSRPSSTKSAATSTVLSAETTSATAGSLVPSTDPTSISSSLPTSSSSSGSDESTAGTSSSGSGSGLSAGAGAGIGIGAFVAVALLAVAGFLLWRRHMKKKQAIAPSVSGSAGELGVGAGELYDKHTNTPELHGEERKAHAELSPYSDSHAYVPTSNAPVYELPGSDGVSDGTNMYGARETRSTTPNSPVDSSNKQEQR